MPLTARLDDEMAKSSTGNTVEHNPTKLREIGQCVNVINE